MAFIRPDEYLIIMDINQDGFRLSYDDLAALKGAGVQTIYYQGAIHWGEMQPTPDSPFDWSTADAFVERVKRAGLKTLIPFVYSLPEWKPDEFFYSRERVERAYGIPNFDNPEVTTELDELMAETIRRYSDDDCQVVYAIPANGEFAVHIWPRNPGMPYPMDLYVDWVVGRQTTLAAFHGEVWTAYHPYTGPHWWNPIYNALFDTFQEYRHYGIMFTAVQHDNKPHVRQMIDENRRRGMIYYGGTEYVQGMRANVPKLVGKGMRMLTSPIHPYQQYRTIEPWMLRDIEWAIAQYV